MSEGQAGSADTPVEHLRVRADIRPGRVTVASVAVSPWRTDQPGPCGRRCDDAGELVSKLTEAIGVPAVVELVMMVAVENERSRFNPALGLSTQGLSERCELLR